MHRSRDRRPHGMAAGLLILAALISGHAAAQAPTTNKWLTVVLPAEPPDLDGCYSSSSLQGRVIKENVVETLLNKDQKTGAITPRLATSWEQPDANTWRVKLRQDVSFHDGSRFNAAAVKRSIDRSAIKALVCTVRQRYFGDIESEVSVIDDYTLQIKTSRPEPTMPIRLAGITIDGPNEPLDKRSLAPVGTGPYVFDSWVPGQQVLLKRNDKYWGEKPQAEGARYLWRSESSVRAAMVKIGEADIALSIAQQDATDPKLDYSYLDSNTTFLRIDPAIPPLNDKRVRLALNYAVDRASAIGSILPKETIQATQVVFPPIAGHNHEIDKRPYAYDPAKARQLLAEAKAAGVPVDTEIRFVGAPFHFANSAELIEGFLIQFKAAGFNMKLTNVEPGQYALWSRKPFAADRPPSILQVSHDNNVGDPVFSVIFRYGCEAASATLCDPTFEKEVIRVGGLGGEERIKGWQEIFRTLYEDIVPDIMMYHMVGFTRVSQRIVYVPDAAANAEVHIQDITFR